MDKKDTKKRTKGEKRQKKRVNAAYSMPMG